MDFGCAYGFTSTEFVCTKKWIDYKQISENLLSSSYAYARVFLSFISLFYFFFFVLFFFALLLFPFWLKKEVPNWINIYSLILCIVIFFYNLKFHLMMMMIMMIIIIVIVFFFFFFHILIDLSKFSWIAFASF